MLLAVAFHGALPFYVFSGAFVCMIKKTITRVDLRALLEKKITWNKATTALFIEHFFQEISATLICQEPVKIEAFGTFAIKVRQGRVARDISAKTPMVTKEQCTVTFIPSPKLTIKKHTR